MIHLAAGNGDVQIARYILSLTEYINTYFHLKNKCVFHLSCLMFEFIQRLSKISFFIENYSNILIHWHKISASIL